MSQQSINAFFLNYCQSINSFGMDDGYYQALLSSPLNPTSRKDERKVKLSRRQTKEEMKEIQKLKKKYNL